jgi:hypothetical protein
LLAFASADWVPTAETDALEYDGVPASTFFAPLALATASPCDPDCEPEDACDFIPEPCACEFRLAIDFTVGDETQRVFDHGTASLPAAGLSIRVVHAVTWSDIEGQNCVATDAPGRWHQFLVTR